MNKPIFIFGCIILLSISTKSYPQRYRNKEISLISFNLTINNEYKAKFDQYESYFPEVKNSKGDKIIGKMKEKIWGILYETLQNELGMFILPVNAYGDNFKYDVYNFPEMNINKAIKKGYSKYYFKVDVEIGPEISTKYVTAVSEKDSTGTVTQLKENEFKPKVTINVHFFSNQGIIPVEKALGIAIAPKILTFEETFFDGIINDKIDIEQPTLLNLLQEAANDLTLTMLAHQR